MPRRLEPLDAIALPQARWEHARRVRAQKPITVEPAKFRPQPSLFYMTEVDERSKQTGPDEVGTITIRSESSEETHESVNGTRRGQDPITRQAQKIAVQDFAQMERNWDQYMFEHMDEHTAKFIILKHVHDGEYCRLCIFIHIMLL